MWSYGLALGTNNLPGPVRVPKHVKNVIVLVVMLEVLVILVVCVS